MTVVLDASALIAMLKGEKGAAKVAGGIAGARLSSVNYAEVVSHFIHAGSLGDRFCLALALRDGLPAWTSDQNWKKVADAAKVKVVTIR